MDKTTNWWFTLCSSQDFWRENVTGGWATVVSLVVLLVWQLKKRFGFKFSSGSPSFLTESRVPVDSAGNKSDRFRISEIIPDADLKKLIDHLDGSLNDSEKWENVIDKSNNLFCYSAKCCKPKDGPLKYWSSTIFENCSAEMLRDFYMDNDYRKKWDKTLVFNEQLQVDETSGTEIGHTIKKFPLLTPRQYVLAWRLWEGSSKTFYCFVKECDHPSAPRQKKYVRVPFFRSGWRIRSVPDRNACEIQMVHQEDAGLNVEMAKLAFARGIWSYMCKMDSALRKYPAVKSVQTSPALTAVSLIQKVPRGLDTMTPNHVRGYKVHSTSGATSGDRTHEPSGKILGRKPSRKMVANGILLLGGLVCLSRGHNSLGVKVALAYVLTKLNKHHATS